MNVVFFLQKNGSNPFCCKMIVFTNAHQSKRRFPFIESTFRVRSVIVKNKSRLSTYSFIIFLTNTLSVNTALTQ